MPLNSTIEVDVNNFVVPGNSAEVNVDLLVVSPNGGGSTDKSIVLTSSGSTVDMGQYFAINGSVYNVSIILSYDGISNVEAIVRMEPISSL